jgi:hypothetical protein
MLVPLVWLWAAAQAAAQASVRVRTAQALRDAFAAGTAHILVTEHIDATGLDRLADSSLDDAVARAGKGLRSVRVRWPSLHALEAALRSPALQRCRSVNCGKDVRQWSLLWCTSTARKYCNGRDNLAAVASSQAQAVAAGTQQPRPKAPPPPATPSQHVMPTRTHIPLHAHVQRRVQGNCSAPFPAGAPVEKLSGTQCLVTVREDFLDASRATAAPLVVTDLHVVATGGPDKASGLLVLAPVGRLYLLNVALSGDGVRVRGLDVPAGGRVFASGTPHPAPCVSGSLLPLVV